MGKLFILAVIVGIGWYIQNTYDFTPLKEGFLQAVSQEKTISTVNQKRSNDQRDVTNVINKY